MKYDSRIYIEKCTKTGRRRFMTGFPVGIEM